MADTPLLGPPDSDHFETAVGWLQSGDVARAHAALDKISAEFQGHPDVLEIRWNAHVMAKEWKAALRVASLLVEVAPENAVSWLARSQALHGLGRTQDAWNSLLPASERFPEHAMILYNLACYAAVLKNEDEAWKHFKSAMLHGSAAQMQELALEDPDLKLLWPRITSWSGN